MRVFIELKTVILYKGLRFFHKVDLHKWNDEIIDISILGILLE